MNSKIKTKIVICGGTVAITLLAGVLLPQPPASTKRLTLPERAPVYELNQAAKGVTPPDTQAPLVAAKTPETGTHTAPLPQVTAEPQMEPPPAPITTPASHPTSAAQASQLPTLPAEPKMGDTRTVDGQRQVYFLGFSWIEDNDTPNECVYAEDMYENGNKVGSMGGGTLVDGDGDINKMVGIMGGSEVGRSCGDIGKTVGNMGE